MDGHCRKSSDYVGKILSEKRKAKKPLMEKMRRARINDSLNELKLLVLDALNKDVSRYSKMEKADVLEMAVQHLRDLKRMEKSRQDPVNVTPYRTGPQAARRSAEADSRLALEETNQLRATILSRMASSCYQGNFVAAGQPAGHVVGTTPVTWLTYPSPPPSPMGHTATSLPPPREGQNDKAAYNLDESKQRFPDATVPLWRPW